MSCGVKLSEIEMTLVGISVSSRSTGGFLSDRCEGGTEFEFPMHMACTNSLN
jgi:hypothetical protein